MGDVDWANFILKTNINMDKYCTTKICSKCRSYLVRSRDKKTNQWKVCAALTTAHDCCPYKQTGALFKVNAQKGNTQTPENNCETVQLAGNSTDGQEMENRDCNMLQGEEYPDFSDLDDFSTFDVNDLKFGQKVGTPRVVNAFNAEKCEIQVGNCPIEAASANGLVLIGSIFTGLLLFALVASFIVWYIRDRRQTAKNSEERFQSFDEPDQYEKGKPSYGTT